MLASRLESGPNLIDPLARVGIEEAIENFLGLVH